MKCWCVCPAEGPTSFPTIAATTQRPTIRQRRSRCRRRRRAPTRPSSMCKLGYANYYFNKLEQDSAHGRFPGQGDFSGRRRLDDEGRLYTRQEDYERRDHRQGAGPKKTRMRDGRRHRSCRFRVDPLIGPDTKVEDLVLPPASGGLLVALYQYRQLLALARRVLPATSSRRRASRSIRRCPVVQAGLCQAARDVRRVANARPAWPPSGVSGEGSGIWYCRRPTAICSASRSPWIPTTIRARSTCRTTISRTADRCRAHGSALKDKTYAVLTDVQITMENGERPE